MFFFLDDMPEPDLPDDAFWDEELGVWLTPERPRTEAKDERRWCPNTGYACPECGWEHGHHPRCP